MNAWPAAFGFGLLAANSPETLIRDGTEVSPKGKRETSEVSGDASKLNCAVTPATSDAAGSNPSGGRLKAVFCVCEIAVKLTLPLERGISAVAPKIDVGVSAKTGF